MKYSLAFIYIVIASSFSSGQTLNVSAGRLIRIENFPSRFILPRNIDIWLPNAYTFAKKYGVLYMQDGQMLFNADQNLNHKEWKVDETLDSLTAKSAIQDCIVVGIWNIGTNKLAEYFPAKALDNFPSKIRKKFVHDQLGSKPLSDEYLKFIVFELKPYIDKNFSVLNDPQYTFIAGSGAGALISLYAVCEYPAVFHAAACADYFQESNIPIQNAILKYFKKSLPEPFTHSFYIDSRYTPADENSKKFQLQLDAIFTKKKYSSKNYLSYLFSSNDTDEDDWSKRLYIPMIFLLGKE